MNLDFTRPYGNSREAVRIAGVSLAGKVWAQVETLGAYKAARNLRKQGYPIYVALALIAGRTP